MFGLVDQSGEFMRKRSGFLTNNLDIAKTLNLTCDQSHEHQHVMGRAKGAKMNRSRLAQKYPPRLISAILGAYAISVGLSGWHLYILDANEVIQNEVLFKEHFVTELMEVTTEHEVHANEILDDAATDVESEHHWPSEEDVRRARGDEERHEEKEEHPEDSEELEDPFLELTPYP